MGIIADLIASLSPAATEYTVQRMCIGLYWSIVVFDTPKGPVAGLSSTLGAGAHHHGPNADVTEAGRLHTKNALELAQFASSPSTHERTVGLAAINALLDVDESACTELNAGDWLLKNSVDKHVVVVGHFPFTNQLRAAAGHVDVLELNPQEGDLPADRAADVIPNADIVSITGTTLLNDTFDELIALCRPESYVMVLGGTTPMSPCFFEYGVDMVAGAIVANPDAAYHACSQGANFRQVPGKRLLTLEREA